MTEYFFGCIVGAGVMAILTIVNSYYERRTLHRLMDELTKAIMEEQKELHKLKLDKLASGIAEEIVQRSKK